MEAVRHGDKRKNIPTGELSDFVSESETTPRSVTYDRPLHYPRDPSADPQLVWRGKEQQDDDGLVVPSVPIYIQEKIEKSWPRRALPLVHDCLHRRPLHGHWWHVGRSRRWTG